MKDKARLKNWKAPKNNMLPDFIIAGAMKSGTTTLHEILDKHPKIFIPSSEVNFFDIDNLLQHSDFNFYDKEKDYWITQTMEENPKKLWDWYTKKFEGKEKYIKGEDSTTYLASKIAAERIAIQEKPIKILFMLRQPSNRSYSNFYHLVRTGRASNNFEDTLRFNPYSVINRSLYKDQLEAYYKILNPQNIKVILFEDLIKNPEETIKEVCEFINVDFSELPADAVYTHANKAKLPGKINLQLRKNNLMKIFGSNHYMSSLPFKATDINKQNSFALKGINRIHKIVNPLSEKRPPKIKESTKKFLDDYFIKELEGIDELVNKDIMSSWFPNS